MDDTDNISMILESIAHLLWPIIMLFIILAFRKEIIAILDSAKKRGFTLKVGGNEITFEEASKQQQTLIADLQRRVAAINTSSKAQPFTKNKESVTRILWVDDNPKNNSFLIANLEDMGIRVDLAMTTDEALKLFARNSYDRIISDMGRMESHRYVKDAGIKLAIEIRKSNRAIPIIIFASSRALKMKDDAIKIGINEVTNSSIILFEALNLKI